MPRPLYRSASQSLKTLFGSIDGMAKAGIPVFPGSPGSVSVRKNQAGSEYYVRRHYDGTGSQKETYIGLVGEADDNAKSLREQIEEVKAIQKEVRLLIREGFQSADAPSYATLASLHLHGLFVAGATLVGSHAFGILLNQMGLQADAYATEDIDVARREALAFETLPTKPFIEMLRDSGIPLEAPQLDVRLPSTSFKQRGKSCFHVDLLVPSPNDEIGLAPVPELQAYATTLPYLAYLLGQTQLSTLIASEGVCPVRVPVAERFAIHKMMVSQLRTTREAKSDKDLYQAAVLVAALGDLHPGAIEAAVEDSPASARKYLRKALPLVMEWLLEHPRAAEELEGAIRALPPLHASGVERGKGVPLLRPQHYSCQPGFMAPTQRRTQALMNSAQKADFESLPRAAGRPPVAFDEEGRPQPAGVFVVQPVLRTLHAALEGRLAALRPLQIETGMAVMRGKLDQGSRDH